MESSVARQRLEPRHWTFAAAAAVAIAAFAANVVVTDVRPGSVWGLAYGIAAAALLVAVAAYGARRRAMRAVSRLGLGSARAWLAFHVYGGILFLLLVLMHSGFRLPTGALTWWLWGLSLWTVASGLVGLALERWIPRVLASGLSTEVHYDRIPELIAAVRAQADEIAAASPAALRELYRKKIAPALAAPRRRWIYFIDITGGIRSRLRELDYLRGFLAGEERSHLEHLERLFRSKLEIDAHFTLQQALRLWLWLHVPLSALLVALVALHVFTVIYY